MRVIANGNEVEVPEGATVSDMLDVLNLVRRVIVVERNGEPVERAEIATTQLKSGDRLEIVRAVAGG